MSLQIDSQQSGGTAANVTAASSLGFNFTNTAGTLLIIGVCASANQAGVAPFITMTTTGVTFNGVAMNKIGAEAWDNTASEVSLWYLINPATGSNAVAVSCSFTNPASGSGYHDILAGCISFVGANLSAPVGTPATNSSATNVTTASVGLTGTLANDYVIAAMGTGTGITGPNSPTTTSALKDASPNTGGDNFALSQQQTGSGGSVTAGYTTSADFFGMIAVEVFAAAIPQNQPPFARFNRTRLIR